MYRQSVVLSFVRVVRISQIKLCSRQQHATHAIASLFSLCELKNFLDVTIPVPVVQARNSRIVTGATSNERGCSVDLSIPI